MESSSFPSADGIASIHRPVGGHSEVIGPQTKWRDTCGTVAHGITELLEPCSRSADCSDANDSTIKLRVFWTLRLMGELMERRTVDYGVLQVIYLLMWTFNSQGEEDIKTSIGRLMVSHMSWCPEVIQRVPRRTLKGELLVMTRVA